jgi:Fuc2NAc and GlcNAc transferase
MLNPIVVFIVALLASALLTWAARRLAVKLGVIDHPNERSSHVRPTPQAGGIAIVTVVTLTLAVLLALGKISLMDFGVLAGGGLAVALVGLADDWRQLSTQLRLAIHVAAALWAVLCLDGLPPIRIGEQLVSLGWAGYPLGVMGIVWSLNLFNFMDGIDGIAASEAAFVAVSAALLLTAGGQAAGIPLACLALGAASGGFLFLNWPPAKIFLGDVGSGYLGYSLACLAIINARNNPVALLIFFILGAVFIVDATLTFVRRIARNERYDVGHRTHGYQRLSRRWGSHRKVTTAVILTNILVLLPAAALAASRPSWAALIAGGVLLLMSGAALLVGCGKAEKTYNEP